MFGCSYYLPKFTRFFGSSEKKIRKEDVFDIENDPFLGILAHLLRMEPGT